MKHLTDDELLVIADRVASIVKKSSVGGYACAGVAMGLTMVLIEQEQRPPRPLDGPRPG